MFSDSRALVTDCFVSIVSYSTVRGAQSCARAADTCQCLVVSYYTRIVDLISSYD